MKEYKFLRWLSEFTDSIWWHDSADPQEIDESIKNGAVGVTTNPFLVQSTLNNNREKWQSVYENCPPELTGDERAEKLLSLTVAEVAKTLRPIYDETCGKQGYACAQVNPSNQGDAEAMLLQARRYAKIAPNVSIKLPASAAGLAAMEQCVAEGMCTTVTASFTVPQALAIAEHYERGIKKAEENGIPTKPCFAVLMIGRLDDYIRDIAHDTGACVSESDIQKAGIAVAKRAYKLFAERNYKAIIMPAGMRGAYHMTELAGAKMVFSTAPKIQLMLEELSGPFSERIDEPVDEEAIARLMTVREFRRAYEIDGMAEDEFLTYGAMQRTLSQFVEVGWSRIK